MRKINILLLSMLTSVLFLGCGADKDPKNEENRGIKVAYIQ